MASSNPEILKKYLDLEQPEDVVFCTYVFVDGTMETVRAKTRVLDYEPEKAKDCPEWTFCGLGTYQWGDAGAKSELYLVPVALFRDPFLKGKNKLVLCEVLNHDRQPNETNTRRSCDQVMQKAAHQEPWFGIEQEYVLLEKDGRPLGWPADTSVIRPYGPYYLGVGVGNVIGRQVSDAHLKACVYAGVKVAGTNAEVVYSQWEYQVGPLPGVEAGDHLWISRYILHRVAEDFGVIVTLDPKPYKGDDWLGSGGHINFSTSEMRREGGLEAIKRALKKLEGKQELHLTNYDPKKGKSNQRRLNAGFLATPDNSFSADLCSRLSSVRIPQLVVEDGKGYLEDRRPGSNVEPYRATEIIVTTVCIDP